MPNDGLTLYSISRELNRAVAGGRVEKIIQPEKDEIHLTIRNNGSNVRLLISASSSNARIHLTEQKKTSPLEAPSFCMILRKHLIGSILVGIDQSGMDRILILHFSGRNEMLETVQFKLIVEIMGRHSNIILLNSEDTIVDSVKHVDQSVNRYREVLPGLKYIIPPEQNKLNPASAADHEILASLAASGAETLSDALVSALQGLSKSTASLLIREIGLDADMPFHLYSQDDLTSLARHICGMMQAIREDRLSPCVLYSEDGFTPKDFLLGLPSYLKGARHKLTSSVNEAADIYFGQKDRSDRIRQKTHQMLSVVKTNLERCGRNLQRQREILLKAESVEELKLWGELLTVYQQSIPKGPSASVLNYYDNTEITIPLDPRKSVNENAQMYYQKCRKLKKAAALAVTQIQESESEYAYLESQIHNLNTCYEEADIQEIHGELVREGYLKPQKQKGRKQLQQSMPYHYVSSDGHDIFVGRNNVQNERLTFRMSNPGDMWLHVLKIPGSHVILRQMNGTVSDQALREAACLAGWYSQARGSTNIPVDCTLRRYVKKVPGAKPGFVTYTNQTTIYVSPNQQDLPELLSE